VSVIIAIVMGAVEWWLVLIFPTRSDVVNLYKCIFTSSHPTRKSYLLQMIVDIELHTRFLRNRLLYTNQI